MEEYDTEQIRIYLSDLALKVIEQDVTIFSAAQKLTLTGFVNRIIYLYIHNDCEDFSLDLTIENNKEGESKLFRFDKYSMDEYNNSIEYLNHRYSFTKASSFFRVILETFVRLPFLKREFIFLGETIETIEKAIKANKKIRIETHNRSEDVSPYKIASSKEGAFSYLIGFDENDKVKAIRLSHIRMLKVHDHSKLPKQMILNKTDEQIIEYGPTFLEEKPVEIDIRFLTKQAKESYEYSILHRPFHIKVINDEKMEYRFYCSFKQAEFFFLRFAGEIEILKPIELKERFVSEYKAGLSVLDKSDT